uniref:Uncharacterized protein n=1 Tax=Acrobeloides nanus TaxID=290746 RepID=A0A914CLS7_9BILA
MFVFDEDYDDSSSSPVDVEVPTSETIRTSTKVPNRPERRAPSTDLKGQIATAKSTDPWSFYEDYFLDYRKRRC